MTTDSIPPGANDGAHSGAVPASRHAAACLVVAALFVGAPILTPASAQADPMFPLAPACDGQYEFSGDEFVIKSGERDSIKFPVSVEKVVPGEVRETYWVPDSGGFGSLADGGFGINAGNASGGIKGGNKIDITVNWTGGRRSGTTTTFAGQVDDDGYARGRYEGGDPVVDVFVRPGAVLWRSSDTLSCVTPEAPKPPPIAPPPRPEPAPESKPASELNVRWERYTGGIRAIVKITNNEDKPPVGCVYKYELGTRNFTVTGDQEAVIDFPSWLQLRKYWPVTVTCDNGLKYEGGTTY